MDTIEQPIVDPGHQPTDSPAPVDSLHIIAVGASAGGLEALQQFLFHFKHIANTSIIVAQHLSPIHKSMLVHLLSKETSLTVSEAKAGQILVPHHVYITPPDKEISIVGDRIQLQKPASPTGPKPSVDVLFNSLAGRKTGKTIAIILSGTGTDGSIGLVALKENSAYIIAQDPKSAKYDGMPMAAINTGIVDAILCPEKMGEAVTAYLTNWEYNVETSAQVEKEPSAYSHILTLIRTKTGVDFSSYKTNTIERRLEKRMSSLNISRLEDYLLFLQSNPSELDTQYKTLLIGVTSFFRNEEAFAVLTSQLSAIISSKEMHEPIRIWVPGCSTGEEAYSVAIILHQLLNKANKRNTVQIFATDIDDTAIQQGRRGIYKKEALKNLKHELIEEYFIDLEGCYELIKPIRSMILFSKHDLTRNPPFLKLDLISCRNLLIYFNSELQKQVIALFHYALLPGSYLFLGKSETIGPFAELFEAIDSNSKIYRRKWNGGNLAPKVLPFKSQANLIPKGTPPTKKHELTISDLVKETLFNTFEHPYVVVNKAHTILEVSGDVRLFLGLSSGSIHLNLIKMTNPEIQLEVRAILNKAIKDRCSFKSKLKKFELFGSTHYVRVTAKPLIYASTTEELFVVIFEKLDIDEFFPHEQTGDKDILVTQRTAELEDELLATKEHLQTYIEQIETSNEELQSLNEELQSTNEELQSSNEELETTNEELQSTTEEIQITYAELKATHDELEKKEFLLRKVQANSQALLNNDLQGFILVDNTYHVLDFNEKATKVLSNFRSRRLKAGDSVIDFLPEGKIDEFIREFGQALQGQPYFGEKAFITVFGETKWISVTYNPVIFGDNQVTGISIGLLDITDLKTALSDLTQSERLISSVFNIVSTGICIIDDNGIFVDVNRSFCEIHGYLREELIGMPFGSVLPSSSRSQVESMHKRFLADGNHRPFEAKMRHKSGRLLSVALFADQLDLSNGKKYVVISVQDVTEQNNTQKLLEDTQEIANIGAWEFDVANELLSITPTIKKIYGINTDDPLDISNGLNYYKPGKNRNQIYRAFEKCVQDGIPFDLELEIIAEGGIEKWVRLIGNADKVDEQITRIYGCLQDITSLKEMEHQMAAVLDNLPGAVFQYKLDPEGSNSIMLLNDGARILWGLEPEAVMKDSKLVWDMMHPDDLLPVSESIEHSATHLSRWVAEWRIIRPSGEINWHQGAGNPKRTADGGTIWDTIVLDITNVKQAEETLERTNAELNKILESSLDVICSADASGNFISVSAASKTVFGYEPEELMGENYRSFVSPETKDKSVKIASEIVGGITVNHFENEFIKKDGTRVPLLWSARWDEDEQRMFSIARDATEIKEAQKQIIQNEKLLNEAQRIAKMGSWNLDCATSKLTWTESLFSVFGIDRAAFKENHASVLELVDLKDKVSLQKTLENARSSGTPYTIEYRITTPSGENRVIEEFGYSEKDGSGKLIRLYGTAQDITERRHAERKITESNQRFIYATQATSDVIWDWDVNSGKVVWGENYHLVFGLLPENANSDLENVHARIHPDEKEALFSHAVKTIKSDKNTWWFEHRYLKSDGSYAYVSNKAFLVRKEDGKAIRVIGAMQDITQKKREEQTLKLMEKVIKNTSDAILITTVGSQGGAAPEIIFINEAFTRVTGYTALEVMGKSPWILQGPKTNAEDVEKLNTAIRELKQFEITLLNYKKTGQEFWNNISVTPVTDAAGEVSQWISIQRDVTTLKHEAYQKQLLDSISDMFSEENELIPTLENVLAHLADFGNFDLAEAWLVDTDQKAIKLRGKTIRSDVAEQFYSESGHLTSFQRDEGVPGKVWKTRKIEVWDKNDPKIDFVRITGAIKSGLNSVFGLPLLHNDVILGVLIFGSHGTTEQLLSFKGLFQQLETFLGGEIRRKQLEEQLKKLFNTAPDIICISGLDGYFKKINPAACTLLEYSEEELLSTPFMTFIHPEDREKTANRFIQLPKLKNATYFENRYLTKSGKTIWLAWSTTPSAEEELIFSVARDITVQKSLQNLLDSATSLAKIGGWEMVVGDSIQTWSSISYEIHEVGSDFQPSLENIIEFYLEEDRDQVYFYLKNCLGLGIPFDFEFPIYTGRGNIKWIRTIGNAELREGKPIRIYGSFQDINDSKQSEKELLLAYEEKNTILESIGDAFFNVDNEWTVTYWNSKAEEFLGITKQEIRNQNLWHIVNDIHGISIFDNIFDVGQIGSTLNYEQFFEPLKVWYSISAYPNDHGISVYFKNITERKLYVEQIRESNERFEIVTQATNDAVWDYNVTTGEIYHGEGFRTLFGYKSGVGSEGQEVWEEKIHPDDRQRLKRYFDSLFENPKIHDLYSEYRYKRADGSYAYVIDRGIIRRDESGKVTRMIGATQDVTERNHYEESLKELNKKLETHAKELALSNAELEQFAYVASHDLQEPLRMVTSFLTQLEKKYTSQLDEKAHQYIEFAVDGARRMRQIILDLLDFSRVGKQDDGIEETSLTDVVNEVLQLQGKLIQESDARFQIGELPTISTFRSPMVQVFQNLIGNALKYRKKDLPPNIRISAKESDTKWIFSIEDTGIGIEKEYFERIFIIFQRLHNKNEYTGTGMGLAIVKKILENLGGNIWVDSEPGVGSTFHFTIPKK